MEVRTGCICKGNSLQSEFLSQHQFIFSFFSLLPGLFCYPCVKVKFLHESWQVWNYDGKCFIPCHLLSFITTPYTPAYSPTHLQTTVDWLIWQSFLKPGVYRRKIPCKLWTTDSFQNLSNFAILSLQRLQIASWKLLTKVLERRFKLEKELHGLYFNYTSIPSISSPRY